MSESKKKNPEQAEQGAITKCVECGDTSHLAKDFPSTGKQKKRFKASDWYCPKCAHVNWDWRQHCIKCSTSKPPTA